VIVTFCAQFPLCALDVFDQVKVAVPLPPCVQQSGAEPLPEYV